MEYLGQCLSIKNIVWYFVIIITGWMPIMDQELINTDTTINKTSGFYPQVAENLR